MANAKENRELQQLEQMSTKMMLLAGSNAQELAVSLAALNTICKGSFQALIQGASEMAPIVHGTAPGENATPEHAAAHEALASLVETITTVVSHTALACESIPIVGELEKESKVLALNGKPLT
jgi:hypothetical protein